MIQCPMDVLTQFPIRKSRKQKSVFRDSVQSYAEVLGYPVKIEQGSFGAKNVVIGNPETAKYLVTAHYDTPAGMLIPNLMTPCNFWTFFGYQIVVTMLILGGALLPGFLLMKLGMPSELVPMVWGVCAYLFLGLMMFGPANKSNANDNTSGVVTVLATAAAMPEQWKDRVCFVLFDLEEAGLLGSASYAQAHKKQVKIQIVLNCDCVGDGDELMLFPNGKIKKDKFQMEALRGICGAEGVKSLGIREKGFAIYPSDQMNFPKGVGIAAFHRSKWAGLYCDKIHTKKDTVLDEQNVSFLRDKLIGLIGSAAQ